MDQDQIYEESFENLLNKSLTKRDNFDVGDKVKGTIVFITKENIFVDINGKSEAIIESAEYKDKNDELTIKKGDQIEAFVVSTTGGEIHLTTRIGKGHAAPALLEIAYTNSIPVHGAITGTTKGGYTISVSGINCFCPFSQIDVKAPQDPEKLVNQSFDFKIIQYGEKGRNVILSRRALLEKIYQEQEDNLKTSLAIGDTVSGTIKNLRDFGVFIDLGGIDALIPKSELSLSRSVNLSDYKLGDTLKAKVKALDWDRKQITLSVKDLQENPWDHISQYAHGRQINGKVVNIIRSGAFVEIEPGLEGFIHISKMSLTKKIAKPEDAVKIGDTVNVKIANINPSEKRISLELITDEADPWQLPVAELMSKPHIGIVESVKPTGLHVRLTNGMLGFVPREHLSVSKGADIQKSYPAGAELKIIIIDLEANTKKLILSEKDAIKNEERKEFEKYIDNETAQSGSSLGSIFKNKFDEIQKKINK